MRPAAAVGWGAVLGWYSLIHLAASELPGAVAALARPLASGGLLVLGLHAGDDVRRVTSWFEVEVPALDFVLHDLAAVVAAVRSGWAHRRRVVSARAARVARRDHPAAVRRGPPGLTRG